MTIRIGIAIDNQQPSGGSYDPDASLFIAANLAAGGTLSLANKLAINNLFKNFKGVGAANSTYNIYSRIYPYLFAGGTANSAAIQARTLASGTFAGSNLGYDNNAFHTNTNAYFETVEFSDDLTANGYGYLVCNRNSLSGTLNDIFANTDFHLFSITIYTILRHNASSAGSFDENIIIAGVFGFNKSVGNLSFFRQDNTKETISDPPYTAVTLSHTKFRLGLSGIVNNAGQNIYSPFILTSGLSDAEMLLLQASMVQYNTEIQL